MKSLSNSQILILAASGKEEEEETSALNMQNAHFKWSDRNRW